MTGLRTLLSHTIRGQRALGKSTAIFVTDVARGLFEVGHNTFAVGGFLLVIAAAFAANREDVRHEVENYAFGWLQSRYEARQEVDQVIPTDRDAIDRVTATDPKQLSRQQMAVTTWLSRKYRVAPEPISRLVKEAWDVGERVGLEPTLILAVMAIESNFNPFAQSPVGAQGLMQVMTRIHNDKYTPFGGNLAAFDPVTNLRVGVQVLKECIARAGSLEGGLKYYVGAANLPFDGGYSKKVLTEEAQLRTVAGGKSALQNVVHTGSVKPAPIAVKDAIVVDPKNAKLRDDERVALLEG